MNSHNLHPRRAAVLVMLFALLTATARPAPANEPTIEALVAALQSPVSPSEVAKARAFDHRLMVGGEFRGVHFHPRIDPDSGRVQALAARVLLAAGQDPAQWTVRVLDTEPKLTNAFAVGAKYIYVYSELLEQEPSDDELVFILGHVLGHSLLKQRERGGVDEPMSLEAIAGLTPMPSSEQEGAQGAAAPSIRIAFSRGDEEAADALGVCIARKAGFDPLLGANYFTRNKFDQDSRRKEREGHLALVHSEMDRAESECEQAREAWKIAPRDQAKDQGVKAKASCKEAERLREAYKQLAVAYKRESWLERRNILLAAHPQGPSRMASIAAVLDCLSGRRDLATMASHEQSRRVLVALKQVGSVLMSPGTPELEVPERGDSSRIAPAGAAVE